MKDLNRIHLNGMRAVEAVHRLGSLQAAADELGVSPGAVSQHVIRTEAQLERRLFERTPKGLVALDAALPALQRLGEAFEMLASAAVLARRRDDNVLTISVAPIFASRWLVHRLHDFIRKYPDIRLRIDASLELVSLDDGDLDAAIRYGSGEWPGVNAEMLFEQEVFPVCAPNIAQELKEPADLANVPVLIDENWRFGWDVWTGPVGIGDLPLRRGAGFSDASLCLDAAIGGQGVALTWDVLGEYALKHSQVVEPFDLRVATGLATYFVTPKGRKLSKAARAFRAWLREELDLEP